MDLEPAFAVVNTAVLPAWVARAVAPVWKGAQRVAVPVPVPALSGAPLAAPDLPEHSAREYRDAVPSNPVSVGLFGTRARRWPAGTAPEMPRCGERWELSP